MPHYHGHKPHGAEKTESQIVIAFMIAIILLGLLHGCFPHSSTYHPFRGATMPLTANQSLATMIAEHSPADHSETNPQHIAVTGGESHPPHENPPPSWTENYSPMMPWAVMTTPSEQVMNQPAIERHPDGCAPPLNQSEIRSALVRAKAAHTEYERVNGPDSDWPTFYAAYLAKFQR